MNKGNLSMKNFKILLLVLTLFAICSATQKIKKAIASYNDQCGCYIFYINAFESTFDAHFNPSTSDPTVKYPGTIKSDKINNAISKLEISSDIANCFMPGHVSRLSGYFLADNEGYYVKFQVYFETEIVSGGSITAGRKDTLPAIQVMSIPRIWKEFQYFIDFGKFKSGEKVKKIELIVKPPEDGRIAVNIDEIKICKYCEGELIYQPVISSIKIYNNADETLIKEFPGSPYNQSAGISENVTQVRIEVVHNDSQLIKFNNESRKSGDTKHSISNTIDIDPFYHRNISIKVKESGDCNFSFYNITLYRENAKDGLLENVIIQPNGEIIGGFSSMFFDKPYYVIVPPSTRNVNIKPVVSSGTVKITINGNTYTGNGFYGPVDITNTSQNPVRIEVTSKSGIKRVYTFIITDFYIYWDTLNPIKGMEGINPLFKVHLSKQADKIITVAYYANDIDAHKNIDYTLSDGILTFNVTEKEKVIPLLDIINDSIREGSEKFYISILNQGSIPIKPPKSVVYQIIDDDKFNVQFGKTDTVVDEGHKFVEIPIIIDEHPKIGDKRVSVKIEVDSTSTAHLMSDFELETASMSWGDCESCSDTQMLRIKIIENEDVENPEKITLKLIPDSGTVIGRESQCKIVIRDNDLYKVRFVTAIDTVIEPARGERAVDVDIELENCIASSIDEVSLIVKYDHDVESDNHAEYNIDYRYENIDSLKWIYDSCSSSLKKKVRIYIKADTIPEESESIILTLAPLGAKTIEYDTFELKIIQQIIAFSKPGDSQLEQYTNPEIRVSIVPPLIDSQSVTVRYTVSGTADGDTIDYAINNGAMTFTSTQSELKIPLLIINDNIPNEGDETVIISLCSASGDANIGNIGTYIYTIMDDDNMIFVRSNMIDSTGDGRTWNTAFKSFMKATDFAKDSTHGIKEIWVAAGKYIPTRVDSGKIEKMTFKMIENVKYLGGFPSNGGNLHDRDYKSQETKLSGDVLGNDSATWPKNGTEIELQDNLPNIVTGASNSILDGFVIERGFNSCDMSPTMGTGGLILSGCENVLIKSCSFKCNLNKCVSGGAVQISGCENALFDSCEFRNNNNTTGPGGGAVYNGGSNTKFYNCKFIGNIAKNWDGGAINDMGYRSEIVNCKFINNEASFGGAIYSNSSLILHNCNFNQNKAEYGGAVSYGSKITGKSILKSRSSVLSSMSDSAIVTNCLFEKNEADIGGAIQLTEAPSYVITDFICCTFVNNKAKQGGGVFQIYNGTVNLNSCILYNNTAPVYAEFKIDNDTNSYNVNVFYSRTDSIWTGRGGSNNTTNPKLADSAWTLTVESVGCINKGDPNLQTTDFHLCNGSALDLEMRNRFVGSRIDMGAFEFEW